MKPHRSSGLCSFSIMKITYATKAIIPISPTGLHINPNFIVNVICYAYYSNTLNNINQYPVFDIYFKSANIDPEAVY